MTRYEAALRNALRPFAELLEKPGDTSHLHHNDLGQIALWVHPLDVLRAHRVLLTAKLVADDGNPLSEPPQEVGPDDPRRMGEPLPRTVAVMFRDAQELADYFSRKELKAARRRIKKALKIKKKG